MANARLVSQHTTLFFGGTGTPRKIRSTARNLDAAFEAAEQVWGEPLECGDWYEDGDGVWALNVWPVEV